jgi:hypothetical protein
MKIDFKKTKKIVKPFFIKGKVFFLFFNKISFSKNNNVKEIIIVFDGNFQHGGLVDRLKGIISFYQIAKKINANFKIYFKHPFELNLFLEPNDYGWIANKEDLKRNPFTTKTLHLLDNFDANPLDVITKSNKKKFIVYSNIDYSKSINNELSSTEQEIKWRTSFFELFKKSDYLNKTLLALALNEKRIAIHTRFTSILGDFRDTTQNVVSEKRKQEIISEVTKSILEIETKNPEKTICIFSDSINFLNNIKETTNYKVIEGKPQHIDFDKKAESNIENHLKTFVDFFAIAESEQVYLLKSKEMYNSAFSKYAAIVGGKEFII